MTTLELTPLPCEKMEESEKNRRMEFEGFVDERVVSSVIHGRIEGRSGGIPEDLVLSSCEEDFAGWALPVASPFRQFVEQSAPSTRAAEFRVPGAPRVEIPLSMIEPGLAAPHRGAHRWWIFGIVGAMTSAIFSLMLMSLARHDADFIPSVGVGVVNREKIESSQAAGEAAPQLTKVLER